MKKKDKYMEQQQQYVNGAYLIDPESNEAEKPEKYSALIELEENMLAHESGRSTDIRLSALEIKIDQMTKAVDRNQLDINTLANWKIAQDTSQNILNNSKKDNLTLKLVLATLVGGLLSSLPVIFQMLLHRG